MGLIVFFYEFSLDAYRFYIFTTMAFKCRSDRIRSFSKLSGRSSLLVFASRYDCCTSLPNFLRQNRANLLRTLSHSIKRRRQPYRLPNTNNDERPLNPKNERSRSERHFQTLVGTPAARSRVRCCFSIASLVQQFICSR